MLARFHRSIWLATVMKKDAGSRRLVQSSRASFCYQPCLLEVEPPHTMAVDLTEPKGTFTMGKAYYLPSLLWLATMLHRMLDWILESDTMF